MIPSNLTFGAPERLLLLVLVAALAVVYLWQQRRRAAYEARFADADLLPAVMPRRPGWQRHLPATVMVLAMTAMTVAFAKPSADVKVPRENATIVVALDTSGSMRATDVSPSRLEAAKAAAEQFVDGLPSGFAVGLVSFDTSASIVTTPTADHGKVMAAIEGLQLGGGTAIGDALAASTQAAQDLPAVASHVAAPVRIVLLSDGTNTTGRSVAAGEAAVTSAGYPVSTIAYGTQDGTVVVDDQEVRVPVDTAALAAIAETTGGTAYQALSGRELAGVYGDIAQDVGTRTVHRDITVRLVGLSLLTAFGAAGASVAGLRVFS